MEKVWYKYKFFWRRGDNDGDNSPHDRDDGTCDLIFNTLTKIVEDYDFSDWARHSFIECAFLLSNRKRWPDEFNIGNEAPKRWIWYLYKFLGIKKYGYRSQDDITRDPHIAFGVCYAHLYYSHGGHYNTTLRVIYESVKIPWFLYRHKTWSWRKRRIKDTRAHYKKRLTQYRGLADHLWFEKNDKNNFYKNI